MTSPYAGTLGVAAALLGSLAEPSMAAADTSAPEPVVQGTRAPVDPLDPQPRTGEHELATAAMLKVCDLRCQAVTFAEDTVPGLGASQVLYTILYPGKLGLSIPKRDGTTAVTFTIMPTKLARGKGIVATGTF